MQITLDNLKIFSRCPRYFKFLKDVIKKPVPQDMSIISKVIKKAYTVSTETGFKAQWRRILGWINASVMQDVDVSNQEQFKASKILIEHIVKFIHRWYYDIYMEEHVLAYTDIKLTTPIATNLLQTTVPIVRVDDVPCILAIVNKEVQYTQLMNDIEVCGQMAMLANELKTDIISYEAIQVGEYGGFNSTIIVRNKKDHDKCMKVLYYLSQSMNIDVDYPSVTQMCNSCVFKRKCKI